MLILRDEGLVVVRPGVGRVRAERTSKAPRWPATESPRGLASPCLPGRSATCKGGSLSPGLLDEGGLVPPPGGAMWVAGQAGGSL